MKPETKFSKDVVAALESCGCFCFNVHGHRFQKGGMPDCYVAGIKWTGWLEFKTGNVKPTLLQIMKMKDLLVRNVPAFVVRLRGGVVYCELWFGLGPGEFETLSWCSGWKRSKGVTRGDSLVKMFDLAGEAAIKMMVDGGGGNVVERRGGME